MCELLCLKWIIGHLFLQKMKVDYMWRDIQRRAENYKITVPSLPVPYPIKNMELLNQVALLGVREGWCLKYQN